MTDKRMIVVKSCRDCPLQDVEVDCKECQDVLDKTIPNSCLLPKWPSVTRNFIYELAGELSTRDFALDGEHPEKITDLLIQRFREAGVEVRDGD